MSTIEEAVEKIQNGDIVAFPTETVYGLGANALDADAVAKIYAAKGRPADNPCIVHVGDKSMLQQVVTSVPDAVLPLLSLWPGPLTLIFEKHPDVPDIVTGGLGTVAVRVPSHPVALELIRESGVPLAAPSANISGKPSPTTSAHVQADFPGVLVLDGGESQYGVESTVVSLLDTPTVLRLGAVSFEKLQTLVPEIQIVEKEAPVASPGMKYKHYAPAKPLTLFHKIDVMKRYAKENKDAVVLCQDSFEKEFPANVVIPLGDELEEVAHNMYSSLRTEKGEELLVLAVEKKGVGRTIMDRLERAADSVIHS